MATWEPAEIDSCSFALGAEEQPYWMKTIMEEDNPGDGVRDIWVSDGIGPFKELDLTPGSVSLYEIIPEGTKYVMMRHKRFSADGSATITYTLHGKETVVYPLEQPTPTDDSQIAAMVARECGIAV
jgi:hypothetical protein